MKRRTKKILTGALCAVLAMTAPAIALYAEEGDTAAVETADNTENTAEDTTNNNSNNTSETADTAEENTPDAADTTEENAPEAADTAEENAPEAADTAEENAPEAADASQENASEASDTAENNGNAEEDAAQENDPEAGDDTDSTENTDNTDNTAEDAAKESDSAALEEQIIDAKVFTDDTMELELETVMISVEGDLPADAEAAAYPVEVSADGEETFAAYQILIYDREGNEFHSDEDDGVVITVTLYDPALTKTLKTKMKAHGWQKCENKVLDFAFEILKDGGVQFDADVF